MTTDIFVKTHSGDSEYHKYCMASIEKFCTGFRATVVIDGEHPRGYMDQMVKKCYADTYTDADYILITDSDTLFNQPVTPEAFMVNGKPFWLYTPWTPEMLAHPGTATWKRVMEAFVGVPSVGEKMRRQPFFFPRKVLKSMRDFCVNKHGVELDTYIMNLKAFSEFNAMGLFFWTYHHDDFHWINTATDELPPLFVTQAWSHDPIEKNLSLFNEILA